MAIEITNTWIKIPESDITSVALKNALTYYIREKQIHTKKRKIVIPKQILHAFDILDGVMHVPVGLYSLLSEFFTLDVEIIDNRKVPNPKLNDTSELISHIQEFDGVLPGITLRPDQLMAVRKILYAKRGIIQLSTGSGKGEVMAATIKMLEKANGGVLPTILVFEPTVKLVNDFVKRFKKYGIDAIAYSSTREIVENKVNVTHPKSLGNDLVKNPELLKNVEVLFGDECHHYQCDMFRIPTYDMPSLQYSIGVSASAISQDHVGKTRISDYTYEEALIIGATGSLLMNVTADFYINSGALATPVLLRIKHKADEPIDPKSKTDWHEVSKVRLQSNGRNFVLCKTAKYFANQGRKVLILVSTIEWARTLLRFFNALNISDKVFASYGSGKFERISDEWKGDIYKCSKNEDCFAKFDSGEFSIMIGTTHIYEGADFKDLDVLILGFGGKAERLQVQGVGRVLRKTKTGKYAYLVDFTDEEDIVLSKHSKLRLQRYKEIIGIPEDRIYDNIHIDDLNGIFKKCES